MNRGELVRGTMDVYGDLLLLLDTLSSEELVKSALSRCLFMNASDGYFVIVKFLLSISLV